jgi:uncharacterized membrane protein
MVSFLVIATCVGAGTIGGVFFAFSTFVMKALDQLSAQEGIVAMQRINRVVLNPLFLGVFMGTAALSLLCVGLALAAWHTYRSPLLLAAGSLYLIGTWIVTLVCSVPRNNRLRKLAPETSAAIAYWPIYVREWTRWNHVRTAASLAASACAAGSLAV